jgi:hypothetical protein
MCLVLLLVQIPVAGTSANIGKVVPRTGESAVNGVPLKLETTVFSGDTVSTTGNGSALILFSKGDKVILGSGTSASMLRSEKGVTIDLSRGLVRTLANNNGSVAVRANGLVVTPVTGKGSFDVNISGEAVLVAAVNGDIEVRGLNKSATVPMGKTMRFEVVENTDVNSATMQGSGSGPMRNIGFWIVIAGIAVSIGVAATDDDPSCVPSVSPAIPCP